MSAGRLTYSRYVCSWGFATIDVGYFLCFCFELILHIGFFHIITYVLDVQMTVRRDIIL